MGELLLSALLAMAAGLSLVTQQVLNANLRGVLNSAAWAGLVSYVGGLICMIAMLVAMRDPLPPLATMARLPWWAWGGGALGALFIALSIVLVPKLGAATFIALLIAGQMIASVAFDHFGVLGLAQRPVDWSRLVGIALLIGGVVLIRR